MDLTLARCSCLDFELAGDWCHWHRAGRSGFGHPLVRSNGLLRSICGCYMQWSLCRLWVHCYWPASVLLDEIEVANSFEAILSWGVVVTMPLKFGVLLSLTLHSLKVGQMDWIIGTGLQLHLRPGLTPAICLASSLSTSLCLVGQPVSWALLGPAWHAACAASAAKPSWMTQQCSRKLHQLLWDHLPEARSNSRSMSSLHRNLFLVRVSAVFFV